MNRYLVFFPANAALIPKTFPDSYSLLPDSTWVIGAKEKTCTDVCGALGIGKNGVAGVVIKVDDYYGNYDRALWEKLNAWQHSDD